MSEIIVDGASFTEICESVLQDPNSLSKLPSFILNDTFLMRKVAKVDGIDSVIQFFVLDDVQNDLEFHLNLLEHGNLDMRDYAFDIKKRDFNDEYDSLYQLSLFTNSFVGLDVRMSRLFWETLNKKLIEHHYSPYDVEKEIQIAKEESDFQKGGYNK